MGKRKDLNYFINKGKEVFGEDHSYTNSVYKSSTEIIEVFCKKHNSYFNVYPYNYYRGSAPCKKCVSEKIRNSKIKDKNYYLKKLIKVHGDKYDFSNSDIKTTRDYIYYNCNKHGEKRAKLNNLLNGMGCNKCADEVTSKIHTIDPKDYLKRLKEIHGNTYEFDLESISYTTEKVIYFCKKHGKKESLLETLLKGSGCINCWHERSQGVYNTTTIERNKTKFKKDNNNLYLISIKNKEESFLKIGLGKDVKGRMQKIRKQSGVYEVKLLRKLKINTYDAFYTEQKLLDTYSDYKYKPKEFFNGWTECLKIECKSELEKSYKNIV